MGKKEDIAKQIEALQAEMDAADTDGEDYEIHITNDKGHSAKLPASKAGSWLRDNFGIGAEPEVEGDAEGDAEKDQEQPDPPASKSVWGRKG